MCVCDCVLPCCEGDVGTAGGLKLLSSDWDRSGGDWGGSCPGVNWTHTQAHKHTQVTLCCLITLEDRTRRVWILQVKVTFLLRWAVLEILSGVTPRSDRTLAIPLASTPQLGATFFSHRRCTFILHTGGHQGETRGVNSSVRTSRCAGGRTCVWNCTHPCTAGPAAWAPTAGSRSGRRTSGPCSCEYWTCGAC